MTMQDFQKLSDSWTRLAWDRGINNLISWLGIPMCQYSEDMMMMAELIHNVKPDVIIETGTALGGTAVFYASMLELLGKGRVISIDINMQSRGQIQKHPMGKRITLIEGHSVSVIDQVQALIGKDDVVLVALDSDHSCKHVLNELETYSKLIGIGSYIVAFDGVMKILADLPRGSMFWVNDSPAVAIELFLARHPEFQFDPHYTRLGITGCPNGFLRRIS